MLASEETRKAVEANFAAWGRGNRTDEAFALLAPTLQFAGPNPAYESAEAFLPALRGFAAVTRGTWVVELVVQEGRAWLLNDCGLPDPVGTVRMVSFSRVQAGKSAWYETFFHPTDLRKLPARQPFGGQGRTFVALPGQTLSSLDLTQSSG